MSSEYWWTTFYGEYLFYFPPSVVMLLTNCLQLLSVNNLLIYPTLFTYFALTRSSRVHLNLYQLRSSTALSRDQHCLSIRSMMLGSSKLRLRDIRPLEIPAGGYSLQGTTVDKAIVDCNSPFTWPQSL